MMDIVKNKRLSKCGICRKDIKTDYKVFHKFRNYHLSCYYKWLNKRLDGFKEAKTRLDKYKKLMLLEALELG